MPRTPGYSDAELPSHFPFVAALFGTLEIFDQPKSKHGSIGAFLRRGTLQRGKIYRMEAAIPDPDPYPSSTAALRIVQINEENRERLLFILKSLFWKASHLILNGCYSVQYLHRALSSVTEKGIADWNNLIKAIEGQAPPLPLPPTPITTAELGVKDVPHLLTLLETVLTLKVLKRIKPQIKKKDYETYKAVLKHWVSELRVHDHSKDYDVRMKSFV